jgi:two-component system, NtrC family, response regulator HydG
MTINKSNLNLTSECYETMLQTMSESLFMVNQEGKIIFCNNAMVHLTGYSMEELMGNTCSLFMFCACAEGTDCVVFSQKRLNNFECQVKHKNGKRIPVLKNAQVMINKNNKTIGVIETLTDISKLKAVEKKLDNIKSKDQSKRFYEQIIGKSKIMQEIFGLLKLASTSNASILVLGETGTGKELVADAIHKKSVRKKKSLVKVNCSALSDSLLESELFGHVKGAFTGAIKDKIGRFELADNGTLFLDEISEVSPMIQLKLLRFLQEKEFERVGEAVTRKSDVRIISASNKDLLTLVNEGLFREDLYYRLKVFPIHLPPLRDRKEDVGLLIDHFIAKFNTETKKSITGITQDAIIMLMDHCWPGNIRELENSIEHAFVIRESGDIEPFDLPLEIRKSSVQSQICGPKKQLTEQQFSPLISTFSHQKSMGENELRELLERFKWKKTDVANHLNINRTTLWRMMKKYNIT